MELTVDDVVEKIKEDLFFLRVLLKSSHTGDIANTIHTGAIAIAEAQLKWIEEERKERSNASN